MKIRQPVINALVRAYGQAAKPLRPTKEEMFISLATIIDFVAENSGGNITAAEMLDAVKELTTAAAQPVSAAEQSKN